jgi:hypothetical protein
MAMFALMIPIYMTVVQQKTSTDAKAMRLKLPTNEPHYEVSYPMGSATPMPTNRPAKVNYY